MQDEEWIKTLADGRQVKFIYQELPADGAFITAQIAGNEVIFGMVGGVHVTAKITISNWKTD